MSTEATLQDSDFITPDGFLLNQTVTEWNPTVGLGLLYQMTHLGFSIFWQHYFGEKSKLILDFPLNQDQFIAKNPSIDMAGVGVRYVA